MKTILLVLMTLVLLPLSACSIEEAKEKVNSYKNMTTKDLAVQLVEDGAKTGAKARSIALCQARVITAAKLPEAVIDFLLKHDGSSLVEKARELKRPGLAAKFGECIKRYS